MAAKRVTTCQRLSRRLDSQIQGDLCLLSLSFLLLSLSLSRSVGIYRPASAHLSFKLPSLSISSLCFFRFIFALTHVFPRIYTCGRPPSPFHLFAFFLFLHLFLPAPLSRVFSLGNTFVKEETRLSVPFLKLLGLSCVCVRVFPEGKKNAGVRYNGPSKDVSAHGGFGSP